MANKRVMKVKFNKKGGLELSIGTIVILVLAMSMLILGLILVKNIFSSANSAIAGVDKGVQSAIMNMFADPSKKLVIYPSARTIEIAQRTQGQGFAFSVRNVELDDETFKYTVGVDPNFDIKTQCKITASDANSWLLSNSGSIKIGKGAIMEDPELVLFNIPDSAPPCTIPYIVDVTYGDGTKAGSEYVSDKIWLTVQPR